MTTTQTPAARDFAAEYVTARLAVRQAGGASGMGSYSAIYAAETAAAKILRDADRAGVDLAPVEFDLDEQARVLYFESLREEELRYMLTDPSSRRLARAELNRRADA